jgi:hypothetical protein
MMYSAFIFGHYVTEERQYLNFIEPSKGNTELTAQLSIRSYDFVSFTKEIARAMTEVGELEYTVSIDRATRKITVTATESFNLLTENGIQLESSPFDLMGFTTGGPRIAALAHESELACGSIYYPQAPLWKYSGFEDDFGASDGVSAKAASGRTSIVSFGSSNIMSCTISCITDREQGYNGNIRNNQNGYNDAKTFIQYIIQKRAIEFIEDIKFPENFIKCRLEKTGSSKDGIRAKFDIGANGKKINGYKEIKGLVFENLEVTNVS